MTIIRPAKRQARTLDALSEAYLDQQVLGTAHEFGWLAYHVRDSRRVIQGDNGYPDWTLVRNGVVVFLECKTEQGTMTPKQKAWLVEMGWPGPELQWLQRPEYARRAYVIRPSDWESRRLKDILR